MTPSMQIATRVDVEIVQFACSGDMYSSVPIRLPTSV